MTAEERGEESPFTDPEPRAVMPGAPACPTCGRPTFFQYCAPCDEADQRAEVERRG